MNREDMFRTLTSRLVDSWSEKKLRKQLSLKVAAEVKSQYLVNMTVLREDDT